MGRRGRAPVPSPEERAVRDELRRKDRESNRAPRPPWATYWCKAQDGPAPAKPEPEAREVKDQAAEVRADYLKGARRG